MKILQLTKERFDADGWYIGDENVEDFDGSIEIASGLGWCRFKKSVKASGFIVAEVGSGIEAGRGIKAGWGIKAGSGIEAGWGI